MSVHQHINNALRVQEGKQGLRSLTLHPDCPDMIKAIGNDYLCLSRHPQVIESACQAIRNYGTSSSGSAVVAGYMAIHQELENELKDWMHFPEALLWSSGFAANYNILSILPQKGDLVLSDRLIHYSMIKGILKTGAKLMRFEHNNIDHLEHLLESHQGEYKQVFVLTESLYSMDGDIPDLRRIADLKKMYPFFWILDEAHSIGWYGPEGSGLTRREGVEQSVDILIATLGKSLASQGAFSLFRDPSIKSYCINFAKEFIYTTYPAPVLCASSLAAIKVIRSDIAVEQASWHSMSMHIRSSWNEAGIPVQLGTSPIIPVILGDNQKTIDITMLLKQAKVTVACIRPPTVPVKSSRLRVSLNINLPVTDFLERSTPILQAAFL